MLLIAHKNAGHEAPENTLEGFEYALSLPVHGIEIDIHLSQDRHFVVFHDPVLNHHNGLYGDDNVQKVIAQTPLAQLKSCLCLNSRFNKAVGISALEELLQAYKKSARDKTLFIEIKSWDQALAYTTRYNDLDHTGFYAEQNEVAERLLALLRDNDITTNVVFISFDRTLLLALKAHKTERHQFQFGLVYNGTLQTETITQQHRDNADFSYQPDYADVRHWLDQHKIDVFLPHFEQLAHPDYNEHYRHHILGQSRKFKIVSWTPNEASQWRQAEHLGLDGIITDSPSKFQSMFQFGNN